MDIKKTSGTHIKSILSIIYLIGQISTKTTPTNFSFKIAII